MASSSETASLSITSSGSATATAIATQSPTETSTAGINASTSIPSNGRDGTKTVSASSSISTSATQSQSTSASSTTSSHPTPSLTASATASATSTQTLTASISPTSTTSSHPTQSLTASPSITASPTQTLTATPSSSLNITTQSLTALLDGPPPPPERLLEIATQLTAADPADLKNNLRLLATLNAGNNATLTVQTEEFLFVAQPLSGNETAAISTEEVNIAVPAGIGGTSASVILWTSSPYTSNVTLATPVLSVEVAGPNGTALEIKNLSTPIQFVWTLPLETRASRLPTNVNYICNGTELAAPYKNISCPNGSRPNITCIVSNVTEVGESGDIGELREAECPAPKLEGGCLYWNEAAQNWTSDGCTPTYIDADTLICECTHLTDFAARFDAVLESNLNVFNNFGSIYTLETFLRLWPLYAFIGAWLITFIAVLVLLSYFDKKASQGYLHRIAACTEIRELTRILPEGALIDRCLPPYKPLPEEIWPQHESQLPLPPQGFWRRAKFTIRIWWQRLMYQHSYFSVFFRFDPRLPRIFRATFIFVTIFHTLFVTTLLYGFSHGAPSGTEPLPEMSLAETIVQSILTSLVNVIFLKVFLSLMNTAGIAEFKYRYPYLYEELVRRHKLEEALATISLDILTNEIRRLRHKKLGGSKTRRASIDIYADFSAGSLQQQQSVSDEEDIVNVSATNNDMATSDGNLVDYILMIARCKKKRGVQKQYTLQKARAILSNKLAIPKGPVRRCVARSPLHTARGWIALLVPAGWFVWCTQYLLAFAAAQTSTVAETLFKSYGISQLTTIFVMQPVTLFASMALTVAFFFLANRFCPQRCSRAKTGLKALEFFSDPLAGKESTALSSSFAYWIFLRAPADVSLRTPWTTSMDIACATPKAAVGYLETFEQAEQTEQVNQNKPAINEQKLLEQKTIALYALWRGLTA